MSTYQPPAPPVERTIHGRLTGVEMRSAGWHRFHIMEPGNQYATKADTKKKDLVDAAMSLMNQDVSADIREQESENINEHTGRPYINRYLNQIAQQGYSQQATPPPAQQPPPYVQPNVTERQQVQPQNIVQPGVSGFDKDLTIWRQTAAKVVACSYPLLPEEQRTPAGMVAACEAWVAYFVYGPARFGVQAFAGGNPNSPVDEPATVAAVRAMQERAEMDHGGEVWPCPDCGFTNTHAIGCPRGDYA